MTASIKAVGSKVGRITGDPGKPAEDEREADRSVVARRRVKPEERRDLTVYENSDNTGGKGEMIKAPDSLQDLRRRIYIKAKAERTWRFCTCMYVRWKRYDRYT